MSNELSESEKVTLANGLLFEVSRSMRDMPLLDTNDIRDPYDDEYYESARIKEFKRCRDKVERALNLMGY